jgi:hypothetical protein
MAPNNPVTPPRTAGKPAAIVRQSAAMLFPQFTTRRLLLIIGGCSVFFLIASLAVQGYLWATAVSLAVAALVMTFLLYAVTFQVTFVLAQFVGVLRPAARPQSPFAQDTPPPTPLVKSEGLE